MTSPHIRPATIDSAKETMLAEEIPLHETAPGPSERIVESWIRSKAALGTPDGVTDVPIVGEEQLDDTLLDLLHAPMERFARSLDGTGVGLLLADQEGRILDRWAASSNGLDHLERVGTVRGAVLAEDTVGTNGVGTVIATRRLTQVVANEHFSEFYRTAVCTGAPLIHPISGALLGAVTLSCDVKPQTELLQALILSLTTNLEKHMLEMEQPGTRQMLDEFMQLSRRGNAAVIGFGAEGLLVQNTPAGQFSPLDFQLIRQAAAEADSRGRATGITSVGKVDLKIDRFPGSGNILVRVAPLQARKLVEAIPQRQLAHPLVGKSNEWREALKQVSRARTTSHPLLIVGEPGTGKTSLALDFAYQPSRQTQDEVVLDAAAITFIGMRRWSERLEHSVEQAQRIVIRNINVEQRVIDGIRAFVATVPQPNLITLTASISDARGAESLALGLGAHLVTAPPLRDHPHDIAALWSHFTSQEHAGSSLALSPEALRALQRYNWPGNLRELHTLVSEQLSRHRSGLVHLEDLPKPIRSPRTTGLIERAEEEAIRRALLEAGGNRVRAAEILGISRATVYRKMKSYRMTG